MSDLQFSISVGKVAEELHENRKLLHQLLEVTVRATDSLETIARKLEVIAVNSFNR